MVKLLRGLNVPAVQHPLPKMDGLHKILILISSRTRSFWKVVILLYACGYYLHIMGLRMWDLRYFSVRVRRRGKRFSPNAHDD